jgi:hypothetical protein
MAKSDTEVAQTIENIDCDRMKINHGLHTKSIVGYEVFPTMFGHADSDRALKVTPRSCFSESSNG